MGNHHDSMRLPPPKSIHWEWQLQAQCRSMPVTLFFPAHGASRRTKIITERSAKAICEQCPVRVACLNHAIRVREPYGIWGGLSAVERSNLQRRHDDQRT